MRRRRYFSPTGDLSAGLAMLFGGSSTVELQAELRDLYHPRVEDVGLTSVLHALSDPVRLEIVRLLATVTEVPSSSLSSAVSKSTMSHHFKVLREAGVTYTRANGTQRLMSLRAKELEERFPGLLSSILQSAKAA